jgi:hypothetical protein
MAPTRYRRYFNIAYSYDGVGFEYIRVGIDMTSPQGGYFALRNRALKIFQAKYPNRTIEASEIVI